MAKSNDNQSFEREVERRIRIMESDSYDYGPPLNKFDVIGMIGISLVCIIGMLWGYF